MHHVHRFVLAAKVGYAILIPALITALAAIAAPIAVAADAPSLKRGDEFIVFRETRVELPGGKSRTLSRGTRGRVIEVQGPQVVAFVDGAKLPVATDNIVSGRGGVARISAEIRARPDDWLNYLIRADLRRQFKDYDEALKDISAVPEDAAEYANALFCRGVIRGDQQQWQAAIDDLTKAIELVRPFGRRQEIAKMLVYRGAAYYRLDKFDEALADVERASKLGYENADVHRFRGMILAKQDKAAEAVEVLKKAKQLDPYDADVRGELVRIYERLDLLDLAMRELNEVLEFDEDDVFALAARARMRLQYKQLDEALADAKRALELDPKHGGALIALAAIYHAKEDRASLEAICVRLLELKLETADDYAYRGACLAMCGMMHNAMRDLDKAVELGSRDVDVRVVRAQIHAQREDWGNTIAEATEVLKRDPRSTEALYLRGVALLWTKQTAAGLVDFDRALRIDPSNVKVLEARAGTLSHLGLHDSAIADLRTAFQLAPGEHRVARALCETLYAQEREVETVIVATEYMRHAGESVWWLRARSGPWQRTHNYALAAADLTEAIRLQPHESRLFVQRAVCYADLGKFDLAHQDCDRAKQAAPTDSNIEYVRAYTYRCEDRMDLSLRAYEQCVAMDDRNAFGHYGIAFIRACAENDDLRNGETAIRHATRACELTAWENSRTIAVLAAAYAESGDFTTAKNWMSKAIDLASAGDRLTLCEQWELLEAGEPIRWRPKARVADKATASNRN